MVLPLSIRLWARRINITTRIVYNKGFLETNNYKELINGFAPTNSFVGA